eukprot:Gb_38063 [translate_table: standard]
MPVLEERIPQVFSQTKMSGSNEFSWEQEPTLCDVLEENLRPINEGMEGQFPIRQRNAADRLNGERYLESSSSPSHLNSIFQSLWSVSVVQENQTTLAGQHDLNLHDQLNERVIQGVDAMSQDSNSRGRTLGESLHSLEARMVTTMREKGHLYQILRLPELRPWQGHLEALPLSNNSNLGAGFSPIDPAFLEALPEELRTEVQATIDLDKELARNASPYGSPLLLVLGNKERGGRCRNRVGRCREAEGRQVARVGHANKVLGRNSKVMMDGENEQEGRKVVGTGLQQPHGNQVVDNSWGIAPNLPQPVEIVEMDEHSNSDGQHGLVEDLEIGPNESP